MAVRARWLDAPPEDWDALRAGDPNATPLHRPELSRAMAEAMAGWSARFVAVEEADGSLIGGATVIFERRFGLVWLRAMPFTLPGTALARAGAHALVDRIVADALEASARSSRAVGGEWVLFRPEGPAIDPGAIAALPGETRLLSTEVIDLSAGASVAYGRMPRRTRESIVHAAERGLRCAEEPEALDETYGLYTMQARAWAGHRLKPLPMLRRMMQGEPPCARLFTVRDTRGLLSGTLALCGEHEWTLWWSGTHPEARRLHAFALLVWSVAEAAARAGARRFNLGANAGRESVAAFKQSLGARSFPVSVRWIGSDHATALGKAAATLQSRLRTGRWRGAPA